MTATAKVPVRRQQAGADVPVWPTGDLVLVGAPGGTTAYALPGPGRTLAQLGRAGRALGAARLRAPICSLSWQRRRASRWTRRPARERWAEPPLELADQAGPYLLASDERPATGGTRRWSVLDPATGRVARRLRAVAHRRRGPARRHW